jgi:DNA-binding transcriptional ArsR family regulator
MLKALADETRWRIVKELLARPLTVGEIVEHLDVSQYNVSKHVRVLREAGILETARDGKHVEAAWRRISGSNWGKAGACWTWAVARSGSIDGQGCPFPGAEAAEGRARTGLPTRLTRRRMLRPGTGALPTKYLKKIVTNQNTCASVHVCSR